MANAARNARATPERHARWQPARDALWRFVDTSLREDSRVCIVGAGNGDDLPLDQIAERASVLVLVDIDIETTIATRAHLRRQLRRRVTVIEHDISSGAADDIVLTATLGATAGSGVRTDLVRDVPGGPYDLVIGDLFYSQLLYPAMVDLGVPIERRTHTLERFAPRLIELVVAAMHASITPKGRVIHLHDPLAWWPGHEQPVQLSDVLTLAKDDVHDALRLTATGNGPHLSDPRRALERLRIPIADTTMWHWPFGPGTDYLVCATMTADQTPRTSA